MPYYGFNFQWMISTDSRSSPAAADERALDFMASFGFNFVRIPTDYRYWIKEFDYFHPDEKAIRPIDQYIASCNVRNLHVSLNMHRAPGYCINHNEYERDNLWKDALAQDAFVFQWEQFAERYKGIPSSTLSFDLLNEPPTVGEYGFTREMHAMLMRRTIAAIRAIDPQREIVIDGIGGGHQAMPELADLGVIHSGRGYQPMSLSHYKAAWWKDSPGLPLPIYPGTQWEGKSWDQNSLRSFYQPWCNVEAAGTRIHIGEFGCHNQTPNEVALRWFADLLRVFHDYGWGFALWEFQGAFGIVQHGRPDAKYTNILGYLVDSELLDLMLNARVTEA